MANAIYVSSGNVYIVGTNKSSPGVPIVAELWKNGIPTPLSDGTQEEVIPIGVFVSGSDVYVVGQESDLSIK